MPFTVIKKESPDIVERLPKRNTRIRYTEINDIFNDLEVGQAFSVLATEKTDFSKFKLACQQRASRKGWFISVIIDDDDPYKWYIRRDG